MANKPIKSINYPGLSDTYTFVQIGTEAGQAADAKLTKDEINGLKADLTTITKNEIVHDWVMKKYIKTDIDPVDITSYIVNSAYGCIVIPCVQGDIFTLTGTGAVAAGLWTFINENGNIITQSATNAVAKNLLLYAPENSTNLVVNVKQANSYMLCKGQMLELYLDEFQYNLNSLLCDGGTRIRDLSDQNWIIGKRVSGYTTTEEGRVPSIVNHSLAKYCIVDITGGVDIFESTGDIEYTDFSYTAITITNINGVIPSSNLMLSASAMVNGTISLPWFTYLEDGGYSIDINLLKSTYPSESFGSIYVCADIRDSYEWMRKNTVYANYVLQEEIDGNAENIEELQSKVNYSTFPNVEFQIGYVRHTDGGVAPNANYQHLVFGVIPGITINYKYDTGSEIVGLAFYDAFDNFLEGVAAVAEGIDIVVPNDAYICRATTNNNVINVTFYIDAITVDKLAEVVRTTVKLNNNPMIVVPSDSIAVVGHEWVLYFGGVIHGLSDAYYVRVSIPNIDGAILYDDSVRLTPTSEMIGDRVCTITVYNKATDKIVASKSFTLRIIADTEITGKKAIFIGDSLTDDGYYPCEIQGHLSNGGITSVGTMRDTRTINGDTITAFNEGRGGWKTTNYINDASVNGVENAFYNPTTETFDFSYYMSNNEFNGIDIVSIYLGTNGDSSFDVTIQNLNTMIESIHAYDSNIKVIICLFHQAANQSGVGNHNGLQSSADLQNRRIKNNQLLIDHYEDNPELPNVYISELNFGVDGNNDYAKVTQALSSRNPETVVRLNNNVHPNVYGYLKIADNLYNRMLYLLTQV